ncbi:acyltransferase domain-containing protein, partial [Streptomyces sp. NPDC001717]|uniref:acyltransferase domain-containing protein n=1 Tax=Streptomyces sp. NPDC001717 TaxID=3364604 RepID=UPI00369147FF
RTGRREFPYRRAVVARSTADAVTALRTPTTPRSVSSAPRIAFVFPGQGAQYAGMGRGLYEREPVYREHLDLCALAALPHLGFDIRDVLHAEGASADLATDRLQPALFSVEYALARLWMSWGIRPEAMIGHSLGEYVAACLAGVFTLEDALALVCARGKLMQATGPGSMMAAALGEEAALRLAAEHGLSLAAVNGPEECVLAGDPDAVSELAAALSVAGTWHRQLPVAKAFHSSLMDPALGAFRTEAAAVRLEAPDLPFSSNVTGTWITGEQATDPAYWADHMRCTVRFAAGQQTLLAADDLLLLEVGPGATLTALARRQGGEGRAVASLPGKAVQDGAVPQDEPSRLLRAAAHLWEAGATLDLAALGRPGEARRVPLPGYPFEGDAYALGTGPRSAAADTPTAPPPTAPEDAPTHRRPDLPTPYVEPADDLQRFIAGLWQELLGYRQIGVDDDFMQLGGDSLLFTRLGARLQESFPVDVPLADVFAHPTIAGQAAAVEQLMVAALDAMSDDDAELLGADHPAADQEGDDR